ncbi:hypothetical protein [Chlorobaculum parvum]|uniref:hypothetical protein n=1 Tax=Chlorobaculum parvum TaxID=274539 RepID=UPI001E596A47|nr:hypothetical protein [Chlorobaculum parvum]
MALFFLAAGAFAVVAAFFSAVALAAVVAVALAEVVFFAALAVWVIVTWLVNTRPGLADHGFPAGACLVKTKDEKSIMNSEFMLLP